MELTIAPRNSFCCILSLHSCDTHPKCGLKIKQANVIVRNFDVCNLVEFTTNTIVIRCLYNTNTIIIFYTIVLVLIFICFSKD